MLLRYACIRITPSLSHTVGPFATSTVSGQMPIPRWAGENYEPIEVGYATTRSIGAKDELELVRL